MILKIMDENEIDRVFSSQQLQQGDLCPGCFRTGIKPEKIVGFILVNPKETKLQWI
jgi:hypothetical protein